MTFAIETAFMKIKLTEKQFLEALIYSPKLNEKDFLLLSAFYSNPILCISLNELKILFNDKITTITHRRLGSIGRKILDFHKIDIYRDVARYRISYFDIYCVKKEKPDKNTCWTMKAEISKALKRMYQELAVSNPEHVSIKALEKYKKHSEQIHKQAS
jgi:hypothetical protein